MNAVRILFELARDGLAITLDGNNLRVTPRSAMTAAHREVIGANKPAIVALLSDAHQTAEALVHAIHLACDVRRDEENHRASLIDECSRLKPHEQADMRDHFENEATRDGKSTRPSHRNKASGAHG